MTTTTITQPAPRRTQLSTIAVGLLILAAIGVASLIAALSGSSTPVNGGPRGVAAGTARIALPTVPAGYVRDPNTHALLRVPAGVPAAGYQRRSYGLVP
jgi:hypothetical protein